MAEYQYKVCDRVSTPRGAGTVVSGLRVTYDTGVTFREYRVSLFKGLQEWFPSHQLRLYVNLKPEPTVRGLQLQLAKARAEIRRQHAALVKRKGIARYQAKRIRDAKRQLQCAYECVTGSLPDPILSLTDLATTIRRGAEQRRGLQIGDRVQVRSTGTLGVVTDAAMGGMVQCRVQPAIGNSTKLWFHESRVRRVVEGID